MSLLIVTMIAQFYSPRYIRTFTGWRLAVILYSIVGTAITDNLTDGLEVELWLSTVVFAVLLATFGVWYYKLQGKYAQLSYYLYSSSRGLLLGFSLKKGSITPYDSATPYNSVQSIFDYRTRMVSTNQIFNAQVSHTIKNWLHPEADTGKNLW
jgi:Repeat of Unknown Function (DUF347)